MKNQPFVIPNYPLKSFKKNIVPKVEFRRYYSIANDNVVLFVGNLMGVNGADLLPKIMEELFR